MLRNMKSGVRSNICGAFNTPRRLLIAPPDDLVIVLYKNISIRRLQCCTQAPARPGGAIRAANPIPGPGTGRRQPGRRRRRPWRGTGAGSGTGGTRPQRPAGSGGRSAAHSRAGHGPGCSGPGTRSPLNPPLIRGVSDNF